MSNLKIAGVTVDGKTPYTYGVETVSGEYIYKNLQGEDCVYPVGMDPIWGITTNKL